MTWMQTYSGKIYTIAKPDPEQICLEDIARSLSKQCRFAGHSTRFYSVAEHSIHVCDRVKQLLNNMYSEEEERLTLLRALLHDAAEAYLLDVPRPLKEAPGMIFYRRKHNETLKVILNKYGLYQHTNSTSFHTATHVIQHADNELLATEKVQVMAPEPQGWGSLPESLDISLPCWSHDEAYKVFIDKATKLGIVDND